MTKPSTFLFDLDGTIIDTAEDLSHALNQLCRHYNKPEVPLSKVVQAYPFGTPGFLKLGLGMGIDDPDYVDKRKEFLRYYEKSIARFSKPYDGILPLLKHIEDKKLTWGIVTNKSYDLAKSLIIDLDLYERTGCLVGGDTTDELKPSPKPLYYACSLLDIATTDCIYVGDAETDIIAAKKAGMQSVAVSYGYHPRHENINSWGADYVANTPFELADILL